MLIQLQTNTRPEPLAGGYHSIPAHGLVFSSNVGLHAFLVEGSRIYDLEAAAGEELRTMLDHASSPDRELEILSEFGLGASRPWSCRPITDAAALPVQSISLNVAQACNMHCAYCYADMGKFGGTARLMTAEVARRVVDRLLAESAVGSQIVVGFMGGEPMLNKPAVHETAVYAWEAARQAGRTVAFSITTNGTLLDEADAELFSRLPFTVQISLDGDQYQNDRVRRMNDGSSAYQHARRGLALLERAGRPKHLGARVTVTSRTADLLAILEHLISLGFDDAGFAPLVVSPSADWSLSEAAFVAFLDSMLECGKKALSMILAGRPYPFANFTTAMRELHRGTHRPHPCGAGAGYLSANAEGDLFACHRLIENSDFAMGSVETGVDHHARNRLLQGRHVDSINPCKHCWARYLCGGGCYHEVTMRGRPGCDYIRGWLRFCLQAYAELSAKRPEWFVHQLPVATPTVSRGIL